MAIKAPLRIPLGAILLDDAGRAWVYYGFRMLSTGSKMLHFIKERDHTHHARMDWTYSAAGLETLTQKFPDIQRFKI